MTLLAVATELSVDLSSSAHALTAQDLRKNNSTSYMDSAYSRKSIYLDRGGDQQSGIAKFRQPKPMSGQLWFHSYHNFADLGWFGVELCSTDSKPFIAIYMGGWKYTFYSFNDAGSSVSVAFDMTAAGEQTTDVDFCFDFDNNEIQIWRNSILLWTGACDLNRRGAGSEISQLEWNIATNSMTTRFSQVILADEPTLGWKLKTLIADTAGTYQEWTGSPSDINELSFDETTGVEAAVTPAISTFNYTDVQPEIQTDMEVVSVVVETVGGSDGVTSVTPVIRSGTGTDYDLSTEDLSLYSHIKPIVDYVDVNPETGLAWTFTDINQAEFGFKAS